MSETNPSLLIAAGILSLILVLSASMIIIRLFFRGTPKKERAGRIPPNQQFFLSRSESMAVVRDTMTGGQVVGCRWRITYDRTEEGRMQARLFGNPVGGEGSVDILLNMIFHKLEPFKTEMEWSYVVMSGQEASADRVINASNAAFRAGLRSAQFHKSSPAEKLLSSVTSAPIVGPGQSAATAEESKAAEAAKPGENGSAAAPENGGARPSENGDTKLCFNCKKAIESGFTFCIYCGATAS